MNKQDDYTFMRSSTPDVVLDGLFSGLLAGLVMAGSLVLSGLLRDDAIAATLSSISLDQSASPLSGALLHLSMSGIYGMLFGLTWRYLRRFVDLSSSIWWAVLLGTAYGVLLQLLAWFILLPGSGSAMMEQPFLQLSLAHLLYGLTLGLLMYLIGSRRIHGSSF